MYIPWLTLLEKLKSIPGFAASAQHVALYKDAYTEMEKEAQRLQSRCTALEEEVAHLKSQLEASRHAGTFKSDRGLLWKPLESGGFEAIPYCPRCKDHPVMTRFPPIGRPLHWMCSVCHFRTDAVPPPKG